MKIKLSIKIILSIFIIISLSGCLSPSPEQLKKSEVYDQRSKEARARAAENGNRPGTLDNIESMRKAEEEAASYQKASDRAKRTWLDVIIGL
ncbi:hypothetical protein [Sinobacterium caligoides]|uniref:hypothetical protein n=1 Tax=Sinobacterium caligoides TaxID=933926 RepID=UPI000F4D082C|nr:hypothetical protein [Sinobacterium caligoides]